jgi:hypothetical protein
MVVITSDGLLDLLPSGDESALRALFADTSTPSEVCSMVSELVASRPPIDDVTVVAICRDDAG